MIALTLEMIRGGVVVSRQAVERILDRVIMAQHPSSEDRQEDLRSLVQIVSPFTQPVWRYDVGSRSYLQQEPAHGLWGEAAQLVDSGQERFATVRRRLLQSPIWQQHQLQVNRAS